MLSCCYHILITDMPNPFFSGRIPPELEAHVEEYRKQTGESKTDVLIKALSTYTDFQDKQVEIENTEITNPILERLEKIEERLTELDNLKEQLTQLRKSLKAKSKPQKTAEKNDNDGLPLFTAQSAESDENCPTDNKLDNTDNSDKAGIIVCPEAKMIRITGLTRNKLRYLREKIEQGKENAESRIKTKIGEKEYLLEYKGEEKEGKKKVRVWIAIPES